MNPEMITIIVGAIVGLTGGGVSIFRMFSDHGKSKAEVTGIVTDKLMALEERTHTRNEELAEEISELSIKLRETVKLVEQLAEHIDKLEDIIRRIDPEYQIPEPPKG
jgi:hypothetical protein